MNVMLSKQAKRKEEQLIEIMTKILADLSSVNWNKAGVKWIKICASKTALRIALGLNLTIIEIMITIIKTPILIIIFLLIIKRFINNNGFLLSK